MKIYIFKFGTSGLIDFHKKENPITAAILTVNILQKDRPMLVNHAKDKYSFVTASYALYSLLYLSKYRSTMKCRLKNCVKTKTAQA